MTKTIFTTTVPKPAADDIIVVRAPSVEIVSRWQAQKVVNALRTKLPIDLIARDVVVVTGDLGGRVVAMGSSAEAEAFDQRRGA